MHGYKVISSAQFVQNLAQVSSSPLLLPVVGGQWGDEGKGAVIALLAEYFDLIVRLAGGPNAGHTVNIGDDIYATHQLPTGLVVANKACALGPGMVIDLYKLVRKELKVMGEVLQRDFDGNLFIDGDAHVILPHAILEEIVSDQKLGIGSTGSGIGGTYEAKARRVGVRVNTILNRQQLHERLEQRFDELNSFLRGEGLLGISWFAKQKLRRAVRQKFEGEYQELLLSTLGGRRARAELEQTLVNLGQTIERFVTDVPELIRQRMEAGSNILFEGAQGTLLDLDYGMYPMVTSSIASSLGAPAQTGIPPNRFATALAVTKWYMSKVGGGAFPSAYLPNDALREMGYTQKTALPPETALTMLRAAPQFDALSIDRCLRDWTGNYGTTTGRPRMGGRFDAVVTGYAARLNGGNIFLAMLDTMVENPDKRMVVEYRYEGPACKFNGHTYKAGDKVTHTNLATDDWFLSRCAPVYVDMAEKGAAIDREDLDALHCGEVSPRMARLINVVEEVCEANVIGLRYGRLKESSCFIERVA